MPNIEGIVTIINTALRSGQFANRRFSPSQYYGIAQNVRTTGETEMRTEPCIVDLDGEATSLVFDDTNAMQVYHQHDNPVFEVAPVDYGNVGTTMRESADMRLIAFFNSARTRADALDCASAIAMDFPKQFTASQLSALGINYCVIEFGECETDVYVNWEREFPNTECMLSLNTIMISFRYKIITEFNKDCFNICTNN